MTDRLASAEAAAAVKRPADNEAMNAVAVTTDPHGDVDCWCCGTTDARDRMVHLGNHPEVHLCLQCAHFVHQQAWQMEDDRKHGPATLLRNGLRTIRGEVIRREWH